MPLQSSSLRVAFGASIALGVLMLQLGRYLDLRDLRLAGTLLASCSFVAAAVVGRAYQTHYGLCALIALTCCAAGDIVGPWNFTAGVWCFFAAHVWLVVGTAQLPRQLRHGFWAGVTALPVSVGCVWMAWPQLKGNEQLAVIAYAFVITLMVAATASTAAYRPLLFWGGAAFYISDIFVSLWRYEGSAMYSILCYPLYYLACFLIALSAASKTTACSVMPDAPSRAADAGPIETSPRN